MDVCRSTAKRSGLLALLLALAPGAGCSGDPATSVGESQTGEADTTSSSGEAATSTGGGDETTTGDDTTTGAPVDPDHPFDLNRENIRLLPFAVRLNRLSLLLDLPTTDPAFAVMLNRRFDLGDYDYSEGINPDLTWSAARMSAWVAALRPLCASSALQSRYPEMPLDLPALMRDAWGFEPLPVDLEDYADLFVAAPEDDAPPPTPGDEGAPIHVLTDGERAEIACLAVLSSLEFVSQ
ncbi:MAG: hypothetical protein R3B09_23485 [Nannocystaceae bacterium]